MKFYDALCPYWQNDRIEIRESESYSYCQFIAGKDHTAFGRARHPFMTGSGGWSYFSVTRYMLGIRSDYDCLIIDPCIPADWKGFEVTRRWRGATYHIIVCCECLPAYRSQKYAVGENSTVCVKRILFWRGDGISDSWINSVI